MKIDDVIKKLKALKKLVGNVRVTTGYGDNIRVYKLRVQPKGETVIGVSEIEDKP